MEVIDIEEPAIEFSAECRCDRCGSRAYVHAVNKNKHDLMFCIHHAKEYLPSLTEWSITYDTLGMEDIYEGKTDAFFSTT